MIEEKIEVGDEVMFLDIRARYIDPFNTPEVGERGIVIKRALMKNGRFGWSIKWQVRTITCPESSLTITEKFATKPFKIGETVVCRRSLQNCAAGTFGTVTGYSEKFYNVTFENGTTLACDKHEIARPTQTENNLHEIVIKLTCALKNLEGVLKQCQK